MCSYGLHIAIRRVMDVLTCSMDYQEGVLSGCPGGWMAQEGPGLCLLSIIRSPSITLISTQKFETVNYMVIRVTAGRLSHIYLTTGPIFLFLFEVQLMRRMAQGTHFGKHSEEGGERRQRLTSFHTGHMQCVIFTA